MTAQPAEQDPPSPQTESRLQQSTPDMAAHDGATPSVVPAKSSMAGATVTVMAFFVLSRVTGLAREVIIGAQFGTGAELDSYLAAFRVPDLLFQLIAGGALGSAFIPTFARYWVNSDHAGAWRLFSRVLNLVTLVLVILAVLAAIFARPLVAFVIAPGFDPAQQIQTAALMRWMLAGSVVFGASGLVMGALNAVQHFALPAAAPVVYNLAIILGAWLLAPRLGVYGLVIGVVAGSVAHLLVQAPGLWRRRAIYTLDFTVRDSGVLEVARLMGPRMLGILFVQLHFLVNTILASGLSTGSLAALNYAWLLMLLPLGIFAQALATVVFPTFAVQVAASAETAMQRTFGQILRLVFFLTIPAAVALAVLRIPLIRLLLERGEFDPNSTSLVAYALVFYALGLASHAALEIEVRAFYALHDTMTPVLVGVGAMTVNILLSLAWVGWLGHGGLALANTVATTGEMVLLLWLLRRRLGGIEARRLARALVRILSVAGLMALTLWAWLAWLATLTLTAAVQTWVAGLGGLALAAIVYGGASLLLRSEELAPALALARRRLNRGW